MSLIDGLSAGLTTGTVASVTVDSSRITADRTDVFTGLVADDARGLPIRDAFQMINRNLAGTQPRLRLQDVLASQNTVVDLSAGRYVRVATQGDVTALTFANWLAAPLVDEVWLDVSGGVFLFPLSFIRWPGNAIPVRSVLGRDVFRLVTLDGGATIYGQVIGQGYVV
jgi:hypothetical protein